MTSHTGPQVNYPPVYPQGGGIEGQPQYGGPPQYGGQPQFGGQPPYGGQDYPPVMQQPQYGEGGLPPPDYGGQPPPMGCPPGLQYLTMVDQLIVKQKMEVLEMITGFETQNKYKVLNSMGQQVFFAKEDTGCCNRQCCGPARAFDMNITDNQGQEVIHLSRPLRCQSCCFPCCLQEMEVSSPPGTVIGSIEQKWSILYPIFEIKDETGNPVLKIEGPLCPCSCCGNDVEFKVISPQTGEQVGMITKQWTGILKEAFTDTDNFGINFPLDLDVKVKATLLGALFLIDFMYFEQPQNHDNHHH